MTAPEARSGGLDSNARGLMVLAVALIVGFLLLSSWGPGDDAKGADKSSTTTPTVPLDNLDGTTTTGADSGTSTSTSAPSGSDHAPTEVSVLVLNGGGPAGAAAAASATIGDAGFVMGSPGNSPVQVETTTVYYTEDYQADAIAVAGILGKGTDATKPMSEAGLGGAEGDSDVVVVLGPDTPPVSGTTSTSTTTP